MIIRIKNNLNGVNHDDPCLTSMKNINTKQLKQNV